MDASELCRIACKGGEMIMDRSVCPICGGENLSKLSKRIYKCGSCDAAFSWNENILQIKSTADIYKSAIESVLEISGITDGEELCGTGIIISSDGYVLTNSHIISGFESETDGVKNFCDIIVAGRRPHETLFKAELVYGDSAADLALLHCPDAVGATPLKISWNPIKAGEKVCVIGNGKGEGLSIVDGIISDTRREISGRSLIMISAPVTMGYSGGPVLNSVGEFIGMVTGGREDATAMNYAIPSLTIQKFLSEAKKKIKFK